MSERDQSLDTLLAQGGHFIDTGTGAIVPPIHPATTYARDSRYELTGFGYSRNANPTGAQVEEVLARLEGAEDALVFASGLAGIATFFDTVRAGERVVAPRVMYHGTADWLRRLSERRGVAVTFFDATAPGSLEAAVRASETSVVWIEPSVNPTWDVIDVRAASKIAHAAGAILGVDATVTPAVTLRALDLGADVVFHSGTKYLAGHSDVLAGVLATRAVDERWGRRQARPHPDGRGPRCVRIVAAAPRHAHPARALRAPGGERPRDRPALRAPPPVEGGALSRPRIPPRARRRQAADDRRVRGNALAPRRGRGRRTRSGWRPAPGSSCPRPRSAGSRASSSTGRRSKGRTAPFPRTCFACPSASSVRTSSSPTSSRRWPEAAGAEHGPRAWRPPARRRAAATGEGGFRYALGPATHD